MEKEILQLFNNLTEHDRDIESYEELIKILQEPVDWTYAVWEQLVQALTYKDGHARARAAQILCALAAKSDPEERVLEDFLKIWAVTYDERSVTARNALQAIWKIGLAGQVQSDLVVSYLAKRFQTCLDEKHPTHIRHDIIVSFKKLYDETSDIKLLDIAHRLINEEQDVKSKQKYKSAIRST
ncbi:MULTISPECIES: hypothetical protein [Lysinibacillus]|jgi:hypothetical protein|uniref:HEAT repeat domain-containing protein n=1 Tax=Lysinibacillus fusiformis TaxID=28031 RepID=A0A2I0UX13_9BACI|nr:MULTISPECIES: hypothetical protein [Lysinibacillus]KUF35463.1 hypothetical protein AK833_07170 [Lysinibacillus sp. F5]MEE3808123.1 hypothetical protein [Lysinibacillus fusiformis]PKU50546.1 hypothetical protein CRI88_17335 [Lysinibacillus fusiformis]WCH47491.1 hypothetical protein NV349_21230 [Lysinibacillus sp. OF-1]